MLKSFILENQRINNFLKFDSGFVPRYTPKSELLPKNLYKYNSCESRGSYNGKNKHDTLNSEM